MQTFGKYATNFDLEYLIEHYIYINEKDEDGNNIEIDKQDLENMLKKRRKSIAGTIVLFNPNIAPKGFNMETSLTQQGFEFNNEFYELEFNAMMGLFSKSIKDKYRGKLIEIKYLFNLNKENVQKTNYLLEEFNSDIEKLRSNQLTRHDKNLNYHDYLNMRYNGKFIFFAHGHKFDKAYTNILHYAQNISMQAVKTGKKIVFIHDKNYDVDECIDIVYYLSPLAKAKMKDVLANAFANAFMQNPPTIQRVNL